MPTGRKSRFEQGHKLSLPSGKRLSFSHHYGITHMTVYTGSPSRAIKHVSRLHKSNRRIQ